MYTENLSILADMCISFVTSWTIPASYMAFYCDPVPYVVRYYIISQSNDGAACLMACNCAQWYIVPSPLIPFPNMYICTTYRSGVCLDQYLVFIGFWNGVFIECKTSFFCARLGPARHGFRYFFHWPRTTVIQWAL